MVSEVIIDTNFFMAVFQFKIDVIDELKKMMEKTDLKRLSKKDTQKLKKLYRQCILKLHPDLGNKLTDEDKILFFEINNAYKSGDLKTLESLTILVDSNHGKISEKGDVEKLKSLIEDMEDKIQDIKEKYPYNKLKILTNPKLSKDYKNRLNEMLKEYSEEILRYEEKISKLIL